MPFLHTAAHCCYKLLPQTAAVDAFSKMIGNAYNMSGRFGVDPAQLKQMGLAEQYLQAAQRMRDNFRCAGFMYVYALRMLLILPRRSLDIFVGCLIRRRAAQRMRDNFRCAQNSALVWLSAVGLFWLPNSCLDCCWLLHC
jgi:hypothetical protein